MSNAIIIGGTKGIGLMLAEIMATRGDKVTIAGRDPERSAAAARKIGPNVTGIAVDLTRPHDIAKSLAGAGPVQYVVLAGVHRDTNTVREYDIDKAIGLVTLKLVGYTACIKALLRKQEVLDRSVARTPTKRLPTMKDVAAATLFLLETGR